MKTQIISLCVMCLFPLLGFGQESIEEETSVSIEEEANPVYRDWRISLGGGYAHRLGKRVEYDNRELDRISKSLMHGYNLDGDIQYFFTESYGIGINVNYVNTHASGSDIYIPGEGTIRSYEETNKFLYVGPAFAMRNDLDKFLITGSIGLGPLFYTNDTNLTLRATKTTVALNAGIACEYKLNKNWGAGLKLSYTMGTIKSLNSGSETWELNEAASVSNLLLTGFISFRTGK